jgi:hypothetical protein
MCGSVFEMQWRVKVHRDQARKSKIAVVGGSVTQEES